MDKITVCGCIYVLIICSTLISILIIRYLIEWLRKQKIVKLIFDPASAHQQLIEKAPHVIGILAAEEKLTNEEMELIWNATTVR